MPLVNWYVNIEHFGDRFVFTLKMSQTKYLELDHRLFEAYIEEKSNPIVGVMEQNMYRGCFDWNTCGRPIGRYFFGI